MAVFHLLNIYKPIGLTSRDAVNRVERLVPRGTKVGHAGTLDPLAEGVLVCCLGQATRLIEYVQAQEKRYVGMFLLGRRSDTEDTEGVVEEIPGPVPTRGEIETVLPKFVGRIEQRPPAFSALKVAGKRAYHLARAGVEVDLASRPIDIHSLELVAYDYPQLQLAICCGSGTYVRSLGRDIAEALDTHAVMSALVRTAIGPFTVEQAARFETLTTNTLSSHLLPAVLAVAALPQLDLNTAELQRIANGLYIPNRTGATAPEVAAMHEGRLVAILIPRPENTLGPARYFGPQTIEPNA